MLVHVTDIKGIQIRINFKKVNQTTKYGQSLLKIIQPLYILLIQPCVPLNFSRFILRQTDYMTYCMFWDVLLPLKIGIFGKVAFLFSYAVCKANNYQ